MAAPKTTAVITKLVIAMLVRDWCTAGKTPKCGEGLVWRRGADGEKEVGNRRSVKSADIES